MSPEATLRDLPKACFCPVPKRTDRLSAPLYPPVGGPSSVWAVPLIAWARLQKRLDENPKLPPRPETQNSTLRVTSTLLQKISRRSDLASRWPSSSAQTPRRIGNVSKVDPAILQSCRSSFASILSSRNNIVVHQ